MFKVEQIVIGTLEDLFGDASHCIMGKERDIWAKALAGNAHVGRLQEYRIPAADVRGSEVFFYHPELLKRFASQPTPGQTEFLRALRKEMTDRKTDTLHLKVEWENGKPRIIRITASGFGDYTHSHISFFLT